jgi:hypothetical protein
MTLIQLVINFILAVIAYMLVSWILNSLGLEGVINFIMSILAAIGVFFANFAARMSSGTGVTR